MPTHSPSPVPTPSPSPVPTPGPSSGPSPSPSSGPTPGPSSGPTEREFQETQPPKRRKKADQKDVLDLLLKQIASKEEATREFTHYAKAWAQELAKMDPTQADECCRIISDAIYKGKRGLLRPDTIISQRVTDAQQIVECSAGNQHEDLASFFCNFQGSEFHK